MSLDPGGEGEEGEGGRRQVPAADSESNAPGSPGTPPGQGELPSGQHAPGATPLPE